MIQFETVSAFPRGTLYKLLHDGYSFDARYEQSCASDWRAFDDFFFDNPQIADKCGFVTTVDGKAVGFVSWDPRKIPESVEIGHNCVASKHKGNGYGRIQMQEAVRRILQHEVRKIIVTTNDDLIPAQRMYESAGFVLAQRRGNPDSRSFVREHLDYVYPVPSIIP